jgi:uroporphyrinogen-III synthase
MRDNEQAATLAGAHVLVTRPAHQAGHLCELITQAGGIASRLPVIEIAGPPDPRAVEAILARLPFVDLAVFVSPNAVEQTLALLETRGGWPGGPRVATVGQGSAAALERHGVRVDICPQARFDSEGLLDEPALQAVAGLDIVIIRGDGGRGMLAETLRARGAKVEYAEVYRRRIPDGAGAALQRIAAGTPVDVIVVTSNEGLQNLHRLAGNNLHGWLTARQLVVVSARAAALAADLGFTHPARVAPSASDAGLLSALQEWRATHSAANGETQPRVH